MSRCRSRPHCRPRCSMRLPYLADYPYGCTEQTLSRFLPAVIVRKTLRDLGVDAETVMNRSFGGISTNAAGRVSPHLGGRKDLLKLDDMVSAGLQRLISFQLPSGAWGWWGGGGEDVWMSAYVLWGLRTAEAAGVKLEGVRLGAVEDWLTRQLPGLENQPDLAAWVLHALSSSGAKADATLKSAQRAALGKTLARRAELSAYSQALLALAAQQMGADEAAQTLIRALAASAVREDAPDTSVFVRKCGYRVVHAVHGALGARPPPAGDGVRIAWSPRRSWFGRCWR